MNKPLITSVVAAAALCNMAYAQRSPVGIVSSQDSVKSVQFSIISSIATDGGHGVQVSGVSNTSGHIFNGLQFSGVSNIVNGMNSGVQLSGILNVSSAMMRGVQFGAEHNKLTVNDEEISDDRTSLNMIFNERASLVYHFSPRSFVGASFIMSNSVFDDTNVVIRQNKWMLRTFVGLRL